MRPAGGGFAESEQKKPGGALASRSRCDAFLLACDARYFGLSSFLLLLSFLISLLVLFCSLFTCFFSAGVSLPPLASRSALVCLLMCSSCFSTWAVSPAFILPLSTPLPIRRCWFSARSPTLLIAGFAGRP